ncbi:hypothetical protein ACISU4_00515 [Streptomyces wuyuanensis]|uniref:hypothetical protein n=1 Tax=Streptomyces wuyuanensis TaxID=1196353 RepID=UPI00380B5CE9
MPISALNVLLPFGSGRTLRTVAQSTGSRNFLITLGVIAGCVINGDTATAILKQGTWLVIVVTVLVVVRTVEAMVHRRGGCAGRPPSDASA